MENISLNEGLRHELIIRVLMLEKIIEVKNQKKETETINIKELIDKVEEINDLLFDEEFIKKIGEIL